MVWLCKRDGILLGPWFVDLRGEIGFRVVSMSLIARDLSDGTGWGEG